MNTLENLDNYWYEVAVETVAAYDNGEITLDDVKDLTELFGVTVRDLFQYIRADSKWAV